MGSGINELGRIGIIANPVAQSGAGASMAKKFEELLKGRIPENECKLLYTERQGHAIEIAASSQGVFDTVIVVGGDGIVNEVANGLMQIDKRSRPTLAVCPVGSGNDYALTLGMSKDPEKVVEQILTHDVKALDVGSVNGKYFVETLSFGIDAAIAIDTMERRKKSGRSGTILYAESGIDQVVNHRNPNYYKAELVLAGRGNEDRVLSLKGSSYIFAVQIGKTYGGHFKICPEASADDGLFDICICHPPLSAAKAVFIFLISKGGHHTRFNCFEFQKASSLIIDFKEPPACQADGEKLEGTHFDVRMFPRELNVIVGDYAG